MGPSNENWDRDPENVKPEQSGSDDSSTINDLLRQLRVRRYQAEEKPPTSGSAASAEEKEQEEVSGESTSIESSVAVDDLEEEDGKEFDSVSALDELGQEVRRMGRELFKAHRATERNQELFSEALDEIRQLTSVVARIPTQNAETLQEARFEAKAGMCRELLRMADTLEASITTADDLLESLEPRASQNIKGFFSLFASATLMRESLTGSIAALRQWRDGQQLLAERLEAILQTAGVRAIESIGRPFDPMLHRAVSTELRNDVPPGTIIGEELKGYSLEGRILRYAEVIVAKYE
jgi:GrpE